MNSQKETTNGASVNFVLFREMAEGLTRLKPDSRHRIMDTVLSRFCDGTIRENCEDPTEAMIVELIESRQRAYEENCRKRRAAGARGGRNAHLLDFAQAKPTSMSMSTSMSTSTSKSKSKSESDSTSGESKRLAAFVRPSVEEVAEYCRERGNRVDPRIWYDYYTANGWRVGRAAMKDWKAAVRTWERRSAGATGGGTANAKPAANWRGTNEEGLTNAY